MVCEKIIIIGAGLGGLSAAIRLAKSGFDVTVLEKNETVGGKVNFVEADGYKFDTGASLLTMRHVFEELFTFAEKRLDDYLDLTALDPICRYFWTDGITLDASQDVQKTENEIRKFAPQDVENFRNYLSDSENKYAIAEKTFLARSLNDLPHLLRPKYLKDLLAISSLKTLDAHNKNYFQSPKLQQLFNRFATYNGSSPYQTPATFALVPFVEFGLGAWYVRGGIYEIPKALAKLAREFDVKIRTNCAVEKIIIENKKAVGVKRTARFIKVILSFQTPMRLKLTAIFCRPKIKNFKTANRRAAVLFSCLEHARNFRSSRITTSFFRRLSRRI